MKSSDTPSGHPKSRLWLIFVAAVILHLGAWTAWFTIAAHHPVTVVPVVGRSGHP